MDIEQLRIWDDPGETICSDAAAEIERLRAALEQLHDWASASNDWRPDSRLGRTVAAALKT